ncbi:hypothetical protein I7I48_04771 [Histoplasma ohiense]|nr:hypothetical protein I7I48_04771 [Histoplasma ohiense (nom. inval.)]
MATGGQASANSHQTRSPRPLPHSHPRRSRRGDQRREYAVITGGRAFSGCFHSIPLFGHGMRLSRKSIPM